MGGFLPQLHACTPAGRLVEGMGAGGRWGEGVGGVEVGWGVGGGGFIYLNSLVFFIIEEYIAQKKDVDHYIELQRDLQ